MYLSDEQLHSNPSFGGKYRKNAFFIRMASDFDLNPKFPPVPIVAVAFHVHEYMHFLHNISTNAGINYVAQNFGVMVGLLSGADESGHFLGRDKMPKGYDVLLSEAANNMFILNGTTSATEMSNCKNIKNWRVVDPVTLHDTNAGRVSVAFVALDGHGDEQKKDVDIGLSFISEGIAYEVEREQRRLNGCPEHELDFNVQIFPYLAYRLLVAEWSQRSNLKAAELISIGVSALAHCISGIGLKFICDMLRRNPELSVSDITSYFLDSLNKEYKSKCEDTVFLMLSDVERMAPHDELIAKALQMYTGLIRQALNARKCNPFLEIDFISKRLTAKRFLLRVKNIVPFMLMQEKPEEVVDIKWVGLSSRQTKLDFSYLAALQSAMHFSQIYLGPDGKVSSEATSIFKVPCPFSGACHVEKDKRYPKECKEQPWQMFKAPSLEKHVCIYACGVKFLQKPSL